MSTSRRLLHLTFLVALASPTLASHATARTLNVNCDAGKTIAAAVNRAAPGDTISVIGTCLETVTIMTDKLTIEGREIAVVDGGGTEQAVITITMRLTIS